jgi:hypothetical protein
MGIAAQDDGTAVRVRNETAWVAPTKSLLTSIRVLTLEARI